MNFITKLKELIDICKTSTYEKVLHICEIVNENDFEINYYQSQESQEKYNKLIYDNIICTNCYLNPIVLNNREFLSSYNSKVKNYIKFQIYYTNNQSLSYNNWNGKTYSSKDFSIDDMLCFMKFLDNPPLPLTRCYFDDELRKEKKKLINQLFIESSYKSHNSLIKLFNKVKNGDDTGDFKLMYEDNTYYLHSWVIEEYEFFNNIIKFGGDSLQLDCCKEVVNLFIEFLYTKKFEYDNEYIEELKILAIYTCIDELIQICDVVLSKIDYNKCYKINRNIKYAKRWIERLIPIYNELNTVIIDFLKIESIILYTHINNDDKNSTMESILKIKNYLLSNSNNTYVHTYIFKAKSDDELYNSIIEEY